MDRPFLPLWDCGWVDQSLILLPDVKSAAEVPEAYYRSPEFETSFVSHEPRSPGIHGPFSKTALAGSDFVLITAPEFRAKVAEIRQPEGFYEPASNEQWIPVEALVSEQCDRSIAIYMLRFTEEDRERHHDWGWIYHVFREFICVQSNLTITRVVFGQD